MGNEANASSLVGDTTHPHNDIRTYSHEALRTALRRVRVVREDDSALSTTHPLPVESLEATNKDRCAQICETLRLQGHDYSVK